MSEDKCLHNYSLIATALKTALPPHVHVAQTKAYIRTGIGLGFINLQQFTGMTTSVSVLFVLGLVALEVSAIDDYFPRPVINITMSNQEVKVDGCATPTLTLAFTTAINVRFCCFHVFSSLTALDNYPTFM